MQDPTNFDYLSLTSCFLGLLAMSVILVPLKLDQIFRWALVYFIDWAIR